MPESALDAPLHYIRFVATCHALFAPYKGRLATVLFLILVSALLGVISPFLLRDILDEAIPEDDDRLLILLVAGMIAISIATGALGVLQTWFSNVVGQRVMHDLRAQVYRHLQRLSLAFFTRTRTGEIQSRIANDIGGVQTVVTNTATSIVSNVTTVMATVVAMFLLDWRLAVFSLALTPLFVLLARRVGNQRRRITSERQGVMADISSLVQESLSVSGILLGKSMGRVARARRPLHAGVGRARRPRGPVAHGRPLDDGHDPDLLRGHARARVPVRRARRRRRLDRHRGRLHDAADAHLLADPVAARRRRRPAELRGPVRARLRVPRPAGGDRPRDAHAPGSARRRRVRGRVVPLRPDDDVWTLARLDLEVPAGTRTAIVGETGAGKTTLGYLVARLYDAERGAVRIDGVDVRDLTLRGARGHRRRRVAGDLPVPRLGARQPALRPARRDGRGDRGGRPRGADPRLIAGLPDGYDTVVGERGFRFSGGEKQRIAIARTVLRNPPVLVLDEATSALDVQTERAVEEALDRLAQGRTTLVIAHRLSTVRAADQIVVLDGGRLVERGSHDELLALGGRYASMVARDLSPVAV